MYGSQFQFEQRLECTRLSPQAYSVSRLEQELPREKKNKWWMPLFFCVSDHLCDFDFYDCEGK